MAVIGLDNVLSNLTKEIKKIEGATHKGILAAGNFIKGESQEITPHEFGHLVNDAFSTPTGPMKVTIGYTKKYAPIVHEMPSDTNWTKSGTGNKFLEKAVKNNIPEILATIKKRAKI